MRSTVNGLEQEEMLPVVLLSRGGRCRPANLCRSSRQPHPPWRPNECTVYDVPTIQKANSNLATGIADPCCTCCLGLQLVQAGAARHTSAALLCSRLMLLPLLVQLHLILLS